MAKSHEGVVHYHEDRPVIHFGSPVGSTYAKIEEQPKTVTPLRREEEPVN